VRQCFALPLWFFGFVWSALLSVWSAAVLCSAALVSPVWFFASGSPRHSQTGKTKAAEQSTAALQTKTQTA
jgi:hypothetical protein